MYERNMTARKTLSKQYVAKRIAQRITGRFFRRVGSF